MKYNFWFANKQCNFCHAKGDIFRYFNKNHQYIICNNPKCDLISRIKASYFGGIEIKGELK